MQFICLKEKKFHRSLSLCLVFFISFSIFSFGFVPRKVKANPLVGVAEEEVVSIMVNILSSFGVVVSIPTAKDFLDQEKEFANQKALELQNHEGAVTKGIQALKEGYYVSKEFVSDVLQEWEQYQISKGVESEKVGDVTTYTFPSFTQYHGYGSHTEKEYYDYYLGVLKNVNVTIPLGCYGFYLTKKDLSGDSRLHLTTSNSKALFENLPQRLTFSVDVWNEQYGYKDFYINHTAMVGFDTGITGLVFDFGSYVTKPQVDKKVIDNVLEPVNSQSQGMVISPQNVEAVGKVLDPSIPDVPNSSVSSTAPISSVGATSPSIVSGADVGALPWGDVGSIDKPTDIPKDESKDIPKDESKDTPKDEAGVDFSPFLTLGTGLKDVFPFCLPFDLIKNLHLLSAPPQAPHFDIDFKKAGLVGGDVVSIDFSQFELLAKIIRFFLTLGFIYFLIIKTRDMIRG